MTVVEQDAYVRQAAAMAAARHALSPQMTLLWEIRVPTLTTVALRVRTRQAGLGRPTRSEPVVFRVVVGSTDQIMTRGSAAFRVRVGMPDRALARGTAAFRARAHPLEIRGIALRRGTVRPTVVGLWSEVLVDPIKMYGTVALRTYTWATWATVPPPLPALVLTNGPAAFRAHTHPLEIRGVALREGVVRPTVVGLWSEVPMGDPARTGTASARVAVW
jgi:hypothetical protein